MDISHSNNNNNNNNNNMNENMNGRRIFKMIQDFAYNVAENFGIYDDSPKEKMEKNPRITEIDSHVPIFGRPETVFDPSTRNSYLTTTSPPVVTSRQTTTASSTSTTTTASYSLFSNNYSNIREVFKTKQINNFLKLFL